MVTYTKHFSKAVEDITCYRIERSFGHKKTESKKQQFSGDHFFSTFTKFPEKLTFLTPLIGKGTCAYQGLRNVSFLENFANVLNE